MILVTGAYWKELIDRDARPHRLEKSLLLKSKFRAFFGREDVRKINSFQKSTLIQIIN